jgi:hypothetical protein
MSRTRYKKIISVYCITIMAEYDPPLNNNALFNVSDFDYQNQNVQYSDVVTLANNQIISAEKTFLSNTNLNGIINEGDTYLENMTIAGNTIIGDESGDTLVINCNGTTMNGSLTATGNVTSTNITSLTSDVTDLDSTTVKLTGTQEIAGMKTFTSNVRVENVLNVFPQHADASLNYFYMGQTGTLGLWKKENEEGGGGSQWFINKDGHAVFQSITGLGDSITLGNAEADTLTVGATATFNNDCTIGSSNADALTVKSNATFNDDITCLGDVSISGTTTGITKAMVSLGNVDNVSDADKIVSDLTQVELDLKADDADVVKLIASEQNITGALKIGTGITGPIPSGHLNCTEGITVSGMCHYRIRV